MTGVGAAIAVARRHRVVTRAPVVLRDAGWTLVRLAPAPVVAKVAALGVLPRAAGVLRRELRIAQHLVRAGAPVVAPSPELPQRVHLEEEYALTFWRYHARATGTFDTAAVARALAEVHAGLVGCPVELTSFRERQLEPAGRALASAGAAVPATHLPLLRSVHAALIAELSRRVLFEVPVHGDPHRGNVLMTREGCLLTGFEVACRAPVEWDLTSLPGGGDGVFAGVDRDLLHLLGAARSLVALMWSWRHMAEGPLRAEIVGRHLGRLREYA